MRLFRIAALVLAAAVSLPALAQGKAVSTTERVRAELLAHAPEGVLPGKTVWVGVQLTHQPEWHTYWKNSGDSGLPTQLQWTLPAGLSAGEIAWPVPRKFPIGNLANYGYEDTVLLPVPVTVAPGFKAGGDVEIKVQANWLVCKKECIPEDAQLALKIPAQGATALHAAAFDKALAAQPKPVVAGTAGALPDSVARIDGDALAISVQGLPVHLRGKTLEFFPETGEVIETGAKWTQAWNGAEWTARVPLSAQRSASPTLMPVVLGAGNEGWRTELKVAGEWPKVAAPAGLTPGLEQALRNNAAASAPPATPSLTLFAALAGALLGGLILNLMPCVFPVLAIKVLGFTQHADDRRGHRISGLAYTAGVVVSFIALGALMLALRAAGEQLGWGFQLQSPAVVAALAALFTLIGLNLAGVFEFGSFLPSSVATLEARHPVANSFLGGVLAVAIASPCTAPFMGASLGFAIGLPAVEALLVFAAIGIGMALPYLAAGWIPAVANALPRPGAWMDVFRRVMAFPMFATVAWLVWVLGQQSGIDGAGALLALLVAMSMVIWSLGLAGRARVTVSAIALAVFGLLAWATGPYVTRAQAATASTMAQGPWQAWEPGRVEQLLASGQPVFVDFTAAWCVTCQYNKKATLADGSVLADLKARNVAMLRADWTRRDPAITAALAQLGRNGVPVYVFYKNGSPPVVLSEILGVEEVRSAIAKL
ncbi:MAG: thioredoxin family protein [Burkholderiales bacterium]|nr:thioredoxin family protein [Burkholderiales bacterium]